MLMVSVTEKTILIITVIHLSEIFACVLFTGHALNY